MVKSSVLSFSRNGIMDWLWQRVSAIIVGSYFLFIAGYLLSHSNLDYQIWHNLFKDIKMQIFTMFFLLSIVIHGWIGLWTVATDYIKNYILRILFMLAVIFLLLDVLIWASIILFRG